MIELAGIFGGSFALALSGALMPGPLFSVAVAESARRGTIAGPLLMTGHAILELLLVAGIILGLGPYLQRPSITGIIAAVGGVILIWMGAGMVRAAGSLSLNDGGGVTTARSSAHLFLTGAVTSISNPYWTLWWSTVGLGYLAASMKFGLQGAAIFFLGHICADYAWYTMISLGIAKGKALVRDATYQNAIRLCGWMLLCFGGWFIYSGIDKLAAACS